MLRLSEPGATYVGLNEGFVGRAYRDSGGVVTIGFGFTNLSRVFLEYWKAKHGRNLRMGDTIDREESEKLLRKLADVEYCPPVERRFGPNLKQHEVDACVDTTFNCGAGTLKDRWAQALARGAVGEAAQLLRSTRITAKGRRLEGLVKRRARTARLLAEGDYGSAGGKKQRAPASSVEPAEVLSYQRQLMLLGYIDFAPNGLEDAATILAVKTFQGHQGLKVDGDVGPATRAALDRAVAKKRATTGSVTAGAGGAAGGVVAEAPPSIEVVEPNAPAPPEVVDSLGGNFMDVLVSAGQWALIAAALIVAGYFLWQYRGVILRRRTPS